MTPKQNIPPIALRQKRIRWGIRSIYREKPDLKAHALAVRRMAEADYAAAMALAHAETAPDEPTRLKYLHAWRTVAALRLQYERALGLVPQAGRDEDEEVELEPWQVAAGWEPRKAR